MSWARQRGRNMAFSDSFDRRCHHHPTPAPLYATRRKTIPCRTYRQRFRHEPGGVAPRPPRSRSWFLRPRLALALPLARTLSLVWPRLDPSRRSFGPARPAGGVPGRGRPRAPGQAEGGIGRAVALASMPGPSWGCRPRSGDNAPDLGRDTHTHSGRQADRDQREKESDRVLCHSGTPAEGRCRQHPGGRGGHLARRGTQGRASVSFAADLRPPT